MKLTTITIDMYETGLHLVCEDTGHDELILTGDGNKLIDILNEIQEEVDPETIYKFVEKKLKNEI